MSDYNLDLVEPTDDELLEWAEDEQFFLFCDEDEFLQIARGVIHKYGRKEQNHES